MSLRLQARVVRGQTDAELVDTPLPPVKGSPDVRQVKSDEVFTPAGLPLRFRAQFRGNFGDITVTSVETVLLQLGTHVNCHAELRLPTDEMLEVAVLNY
jgi:hypothetical protein